MKQFNKIFLLLEGTLAIVLLNLYSPSAYSQCNTTAWRARSQNTQGCITPWSNAGPFVNTTNGVLQMLRTQQACPTNTNFYPEFEINGNLCITNNFSYEIRFRNLNPLTYPSTFSAYDVYMKLRSAGNQESGVALFDSNPNYNWAAPYTRLYAGPTGAPAQQVGSGFSCLRPNMNNWNIVTLRYQNNVLTCLINGVACANLTYTNDICNITSLSVMFKSEGELDWVRILDAGGSEIWREDFNSTSNPICFAPFPACTNANMAPTFDAPTCADNNLYLFANANQQLMSYSWTGPNGFTSTQENPQITNPTAAANGTYTLTGQLNSCSPPITRSVVVNFIVPSIISNIPDVTICNGDSVQLTAIGGGTYSWTPNTNISNTSISNPIVWPTATTNYIVTITNGTCVKLDTVTVTVNNCTKCIDSCYWNILGNAHITPANFLGTINNADLRIRTNNRERMIITAAGNIGINLATNQLPNARLHIDNNGVANTRLQNLPFNRQSANLYVDPEGFIYAGRRFIFGRETDDADKDIEDRIAIVESHINNVSNNTSSLEARSQSNLEIINETQSLITSLANQVNELQSKIDDINHRLDNCGCLGNRLESAKSGDQSRDNTAAEKAMIKSINPNPFAKTTSVHYILPAATQKAELRLINISGGIIKVISISNSQSNGHIALSEPHVAKGSYLLVLIVDGKVADSKIIVTTGS